MLTKISQEKIFAVSCTDNLIRHSSTKSLVDDLTNRFINMVKNQFLTASMISGVYLNPIYKLTITRDPPLRITVFHLYVEYINSGSVIGFFNQCQDLKKYVKGWLMDKLSGG